MEGEGSLTRRIAVLGRLAIVEDDLRTGHAGNPGQGAEDRFLAQIRNDAQPDEETGLGWPQAG